MDVDAPRVESSDPRHLAELEHAQQLRLRRWRQAADLVEEQRAAVGELEEAGLVVAGAEEAAADVAEQLALEQRVVDRRAVDRDEPPLAPRPEAVEGARDQLLARPGLARDQGQPDVRRQPPDHAEQILHPRRAADHAAELEAARELAFDREHALPPLDLVTHAGEQLLEPAEVERLAEVVHRAELDRLDRGVDRGVAGHQHGLTVRVDVADRAQDVEPADVRHPQIDHHEVGPPRLNQGDGVAAARTGRNLEPDALGEAGDQIENALFVVDDDE